MPRKLTEEQAQKARENGKLGGRPPKYTVDELNAKIDEYFELHQTKDNIPKWPDMLNYLSISDDTLLNYRTKDEYVKAGYSDAVKRAERRFSETLIQLAVDNPNLQTLCIFLLKQPHNGGYTDKQQVESTGKQSVEVVIKTI